MNKAKTFFFKGGGGAFKYHLPGYAAPLLILYAFMNTIGIFWIIFHVAFFCTFSFNLSKIRRILKPICLCVTLSLCHPVSLSLCVAVTLCICYFVYLSLCVSVTLCICHSVYLSLYVSVTLFICHSVSMSLCVSVTLCICHSVYLSLCVSVTLCFCHSVSLKLNFKNLHFKARLEKAFLVLNGP